MAAPVYAYRAGRRQIDRDVKARQELQQDKGGDGKKML